MDDVEAKILSYPHLSAEEQHEVETYVESNPEWASLLRDVRALERLGAESRAALPSDALLATYVAVQHFHPGGIEGESPALQKSFARLEALIEEDEGLRREVELARRRLQKAEAALDPVSQFEALTGHALEEEPETHEATASESQRTRASTPSVLEVFFQLPLLLRRSAVAIVLLVGVYAGLYGVSVATQSSLDRLATADVNERVIESYVETETRDAVPEPDTLAADALYLEALSTLQSARTSTLGLFPRYDIEKLDQSQQLFDQVLDRVEPGSFLALEAHFYLGKVFLAQEQVEAARQHFETVVKRQGRMQDEAAEILNTLQQEQMGEDR